MFFVISGYLITKGIIIQVRENRFSYSDFYIRRARRLLPALIVTVSLSYVGAAFLFSPVDFRLMSLSTIFSIVGVSNIYFWLSSGYFDADSLIKPLLHTWSLSVEMQFYLVWPFLIVFFALKARRFLFQFIVIFTILLSIISILYLKHDSEGAFFLTPFRMHEFSIGALVLYFERFKLNKKTHNILYSLGLFFIVYCVFSYNSESMNFPGYAALAPVIGAALMILSGGNCSASKISSNRLMRFIGEISYSLYLVHWPIFVLFQYFYGNSLSIEIRVSLIVVTVVLSILMYLFVEKPFRNKKTIKITDGGFLKSCATLSMLVVFISLSSWHGDGWAWRVPSEIREINKIDMAKEGVYIWKNFSELTKKKTFSEIGGKEKIYIIGDSQSADIVNIMSESKDYNHYDIITYGIITDCGSPYVAEKDRDEYFHKINRKTAANPTHINTCNMQMDNVFNKSILASADKIFLAIRWEDYSLPYLKLSVDKIRSMSNAKIYVFGRKTMDKGSVDIVNLLGTKAGLERFAYKFKSAYTEKVNNEVRVVPGTIFIDMMSLSCPEEGRCVVLSMDKPIFSDPSHITKEGAKFLSRDFIRLINSANDLTTA